MPLRIQPNSKLVMIGDSITDCERTRPVGEGLFGALGKGYVGLVDGLLQATLPQQRVRVANMGIGGNTVRDLDARWQTDVLEQQPDWLSIMIGINDVWRQFDLPLQSEIHVPLDEYGETLTRLVAATRPRLQGLVRHAHADLRAQRRQVRKRRTQDDAAWQVLRAQRRQQRTRPPAPARRGHRRQADANPAHWRALRAQGRQQRADRTREDAAWRAARQVMREHLHRSAVITAWIAILVITDNGTRQCLGVPLFVAGARVTADMVVTALRALVPAELQFLISDRGVHFTAHVFQQLATLPRAPHYWGATAAECWPCLGRPDSSPKITASSSPRVCATNC